MNDNPNLRGRVLVVDDEIHQRTILFEVISNLKFEVSLAKSGDEAFQRIKDSTFDLLITDLKMPGMNGIELLGKVKSEDSAVSTIVITAHGSIETAVEAMKKGADDYLIKPIDIDELELVINKIFEKRDLIREKRILLSENELLKKDLRIRYQVTNLIGKTPAIKKLQTEIQKQLKSNAPLVFLGEQGVGKEELARIVHYNGIRSPNSLITFDCLAVPEDLHEGQLFGNDVPALPEVLKAYSSPGLVEKAHLGTLVIENIHRLNPKCYSTLIRVMTEEKTRRTGGSEFHRVSCGIIATSEKNDFGKCFTENKMRKDVFEIFMENVIEVPPLRERKEDIPLLIAVNARLIGQVLGKEIIHIDKDVIDKFGNYDFPGNLKELAAMVETAVMNCDGQVLSLKHFLRV